jgi:hypothetical protein
MRDGMGRVLVHNWPKEMRLPLLSMYVGQKGTFILDILACGSYPQIHLQPSGRNHNRRQNAIPNRWAETAVLRDALNEVEMDKAGDGTKRAGVSVWRGGIKKGASIDE